MMLKQNGTLHLSKSRLLHNLGLIREKIGAPPAICPVIKANAYGHGAESIVEMLRTERISWVAVYSLREATGLPTNLNVLVLAPLVIQGRPGFDRIALDLRHLAVKTRLNVTDVATAQALSAFAVRESQKREHPLTFKIHVQIDTGLTRVGVAPEDASSFADAVAALPGIDLEGVFTHLSHGDSPGHRTLMQQQEAFFGAALPLKATYPGLLLHMQNSGGTFTLPTKQLDMVRVGIALYGLQPSTQDPIAGLLPIAHLTAPILAIHERPAGTGVGYGHTFVTARRSRLGIVPVGYADGYPRQLSNSKHAVAQVSGRNVAVVGRVSMDQIILDVTDVPEAVVGGEVTVISNDPTALNSVDAMADGLGTIGYELATHFGARLDRVLVE